MTTSFLRVMKRIHDEGVWVENPRTGEKCLTVINVNMVYEPNDPPPVDSTRKIKTENAIAELIGYIRGVTSAAEMRKIGTKTWDGNANHTPAWLANPRRKGEDDMGLTYGAVAKNWPVVEVDTDPNGPGFRVTGTIDLIRKVYNNLKAGVDDRGEIITFWNPGMFQLGCLRPCMYEHQFSILNGTLYLNSNIRSADWPLGVDNVNMLQVYTFLRLMAQITGLKVGRAFHSLVNCHIYDNQYELSLEHVSREPLDNPELRLWINPEIRTLEDIETWVTVDDIKVLGYDNYHPVIKYPLTV